MDELLYKWINFGILAVAILYLIAKFMVPALKARAIAIVKDLDDSKAKVAEANARVAQLTSKLGNFEGEIQEVRARARSEREIEAERISAQTKDLLAKLNAQRETEISNATQAAQAQLRSFTATKAIDLAEARLRSQQSPELVQAFIADLKIRESR